MGWTKIKWYKFSTKLQKRLEDLIWNQIKLRERYHLKIHLNINCIDILWYFDHDVTVREKAIPLYKEKNIYPINHLINTFSLPIISRFIFYFWRSVPLFGRSYIRFFFHTLTWHKPERGWVTDIFVICYRFYYISWQYNIPF